MNTIVIAVVGPTAVGKSSLALSLAASLDGEVVNADSRQVYRGMDVGTGKPSPADRRRRPHHLFDIVGPEESFSLAVYLDAAREAIQAIHARGAPAIVVGGTGQYLWALLEGWRIPRVPPNPALRAELQERADKVGASALHQELASLDPVAAQGIHPNNLRRTVRALEVIRATGQRFSEVRGVEPPGWEARVLGLTLEREALHDRIQERIASQIQGGWPEEVTCLLKQGHGPELPSFASLGYREMATYVRGETTLEEAQARIVTLTRRFAHRQYAWFRLKDPRIHWLEATDEAAETALTHLSEESQ